MALRAYRCVLLKAKRAFSSDKTVFRQVDQFTCELDLDDGMGHTVRAALLHGVRQYGGPDADASQHRMNVIDPKNGRTVRRDFTAPPEA